MLVEQEEIDRIEIVGKERHIQVKKVVKIVDDVTGEVKGQSNHRDTIEPDDDDKASSFGLEVADLATRVWTPEIRGRAQARKAEREAEEAAANARAEAARP